MKRKVRIYLREGGPHMDVTLEDGENKVREALEKARSPAFPIPTDEASFAITGNGFAVYYTLNDDAPSSDTDVLIIVPAVQLYAT